DQTIAEIEDTGPGATGDNLIERIKGIKGISRGVRLHLTSTRTQWLTGKSRCVWRRYSIQVAVGRNGQGWLPFRDERTRRNRRQFVVLFDVIIIEVAENLNLVTTDLVAEGRVTTPSFMFRI